MASERRSARQPKVVKKEPSVAIAASVAAELESDAPEHWIAIDLVKALPGIAISDSMQIIIEGVADGARFSSGRNNGDKTWSLTPGDLVGLGYLPPPGRRSEDQSFIVRLLTYDPDGYQIASTTAQVAVSVDGVTTRRPVRLEFGEGEGGAIDAIRELEFARRLTEAERAWHEAEAALIQQLEDSWHSAAEEQLRTAEEAWRQAEADRNRVLNDRLTEMARRLREAEMEWNRAESERISAALAQAADFTAQRFAAAEEQWRDEADRRVAEAERAAEGAIAAARAEAETKAEAGLEARATALSEEAEAQLQARLEQAELAFEQRLQAELARQQSRAEAERRLAVSEAELRLQPELARSAAQRKKLEAALQRLQTEAEELRRAHEHELSQRQQAWETERAAIMAAASPDLAVTDKLTALEEHWRAEADRMTQQAEARVRIEAEQRLTEAEASWAEIAERRIAEAQQEWETATEQNLEQREATEAQRSEQHLAAMRARMAEVERLAAEADRRIAERERQLVEAMAARDHADKELAAASHRLQEEHHRRLGEAETAWREAEAERFNEAQAAWATAEAARLAAAQAQWIAGEEERLQTAIAAERVMLAGSEVGQMLNQSEARWREAETDRLQAAEARWKMEEDQRVATAVAAAREDMERMVEARLHRELAVDARRLVERSGRGFTTTLSLLRWSATGAGAAALAGLLYMVAPQIKALMPEPGTAVAAAPSRLRIEPALPEPAPLPLVVAAEFVNLRSEPSTSAPVVARLERGTPLIASERRHNWIRAASADGRSEGWIHRSLLEGPLPPAN